MLEFKTVCVYCYLRARNSIITQIFDTLVPGMDWGIQWLEVLEPDKNEWHATNGGKEMKLFNCTYYIVQHWEYIHTLNYS
jgi:hypothetical protein